MKAKDKKIKIQFEAPQQMAEELRREAKKDYTSTSSIIRRAVAEYFNKRGV